MRCGALTVWIVIVWFAFSLNMVPPRRDSESPATYNRPTSPVPQPTDALLTSEVSSPAVSAPPVSISHRASSEVDATVAFEDLVYGNHTAEGPQYGFSGPIVDFGARERDSSIDAALALSHQDSSNVTPKDVPTKTAAEQTEWSPFWLHKLWLAAFATLFAILAIILLALYFTSARLDGLGASRGTKGMTYFWKFLPTASECAFNLILSFN
jgi:hypothetical protein